MSKSALLVVDVQTGTTAPLIGKDPFLKNVNAVIDHFHKKRLPVVLIKKAGYGELSPKLHQEVCDLVVEKVQMNTFKAAEF